MELSDAAAGVEATLEALDFNPAELEALEERLFAIRALARKHGVLPDDLGTHLAAMKTRLEALDSGSKGLKTLMKAVADARGRLYPPGLCKPLRTGALRPRRLTSPWRGAGPVQDGTCRFHDRIQHHAIRVPMGWTWSHLPLQPIRGHRPDR